MERFDYDSGLVYRETIIRPRKGQRPWVHRCPSDQMSKVPLDTRDVQSLRAIAMRRIVDQAHTLTLETLKAVPATIVVQIWNEIRRASRESLHIWKVFVESGHGNRSLMHTARAGTFEKPKVEYFADITSTDFAWLTRLTLRGSDFLPCELMQLSAIKNLQSLYIQQRPAEYHNRTFNNRTLKYLVQFASTRGELSRLETLFIDEAPGITARALSSLNGFPALTTFCVYRTHIRRRDAKMSENHGWRDVTDSKMMAYADNQRLRTCYEGRSVSCSFNTLVDDFISTHDARKAHLAKDVPLLNVVLGTAAKSTHICAGDDLLCFERIQSPDDSHKCGQAHINFSTGMTDASQIRSAPKKRKLKDGKAVSLGGMLDTF